MNTALQYSSELSCLLMLLLKYGEMGSTVFLLVETKFLLLPSRTYISNHFSIFWDQPISWGCTGDTISEKNKCGDLVSANIRKVKDARLENWSKH